MRHGGKEHTQAIGEQIAKAAVALSTLAQLNGFIVTINTSPLQPLAMGNYQIDIEIRPSHQAYRSAS